jgi:hypothetical protein
MGAFVVGRSVSSFGCGRECARGFNGSICREVLSVAGVRMTGGAQGGREATQQSLLPERNGIISVAHITRVTMGGEKDECVYARSPLTHYIPRLS